MKIKKLLFVLLSVSLLSACEFSFKSGKGDEVKEKKVCFPFCPKKVEKKEKQSSVSFNVTQEIYGEFTPQQRDIYNAAVSANNMNDMQTAKILIKQLAEQGVAQAQNDLGGIYLMEKNYQQAKHWLELSAGQNHPMAQNNLGILYMNGLGVTKDYAKAKEYFELAAEKGYSMGHSNLGVMYFQGLFGERDCQKAKYHLELAVEKYNPVAQNLLGAMYAHGICVRQDRGKGIAFLRQAAEQGNQDAKKNLKEMGL
ncbi:MAG: sel1 repeat family protein [Neisseriaceae bacterium]|nr:sel1 repeat family protein [Neisseriaceae bacterium]MBQ9725547.1 sel1 repeat family protein [Neisseriaceae bacterium]